MVALADIVPRLAAVLVPEGEELQPVPALFEIEDGADDGKRPAQVQPIVHIDLGGTRLMGDEDRQAIELFIAPAFRFRSVKIVQKVAEKGKRQFALEAFAGQGEHKIERIFAHVLHVGDAAAAQAS